MIQVRGQDLPLARATSFDFHGWSDYPARPSKRAGFFSQGKGPPWSESARPRRAGLPVELRSLPA
jgi:hypothetical protein